MEITNSRYVTKTYEGYQQLKICRLPEVRKLSTDQYMQVIKKPKYETYHEIRHKHFEICRIASINNSMHANRNSKRIEMCKLSELRGMKTIDNSIYRQLFTCAGYSLYPIYQQSETSKLSANTELTIWYCFRQHKLWTYRSNMNIQHRPLFTDQLLCARCW
jgi:hypothetical protein